MASCPASQIFRPRLAASRVAPGLAPSGFAKAESASCPAHSVPLARRWAKFQVALKPIPFGVAGRLIFGLPRFSAVRLTAPALPGYPGFGLRSWVDDEFLAALELCILGLRRG
jgi:hypothetical protein